MDFLDIFSTIQSENICNEAIVETEFRCKTVIKTSSRAQTTDCAPSIVRLISLQLFVHFSFKSSSTQSSEANKKKLSFFPPPSHTTTPKAFYEIAKRIRPISRIH